MLENHSSFYAKNYIKETSDKKNFGDHVKLEEEGINCTVLEKCSYFVEVTIRIETGKNFKD